MSQEVDTAKIRLWLSRQRLLEAVLAVWAAGGLLVLGAAALVACYVLFHALLSLAPVGWERFSQDVRAGVSLALVVPLYAALWVGTRRQGRRQARRRGRPRPGEPDVGAGPGIGDASEKKSPPGALRRVCAAVLFAGLRSVPAALWLLALALRLLRMDVPLCSRALATVFARGGMVPLEDLARETAGRLPANGLAQLRDVRGVVFHDCDPPGISLSARLRDEIASVLAGRRTP